MITIVYEDNHCLAINKPAGMLSQGDITGDPSAVDLVREDLRIRYNKPGNIFVGLVHRLDRPVSGVLLLAKTSKGASRLSAQFQSRDVEKTYLAIVEGEIATDSGEWLDHLIKDEHENRVRVGEGGSEAGLIYRVLDRRRSKTLIELKPTTGRGHQLRVQLASRGYPIVGDRKYGASQSARALDGAWRIALHASLLEINHPTRPERLSLSASLPADWPAF